MNWKRWMPIFTGSACCANWDKRKRGNLMAEKLWKVKERFVARWFGCKDRTPLSGRNSKHTASDTLHKILFIEQKHSVRHAVVNVWDKAKGLADAENKIPVVTLTVKGRRGFWVLVKNSDLLAVANQREVAKKKVDL